MRVSFFFALNTGRDINYVMPVVSIFLAFFFFLAREKYDDDDDDDDGMA